MALEICGVARSRAFRTLWMAAELGLDYEHVTIDFADGATVARLPGDQPRTGMYRRSMMAGSACRGRWRSTLPRQKFDGGPGLYPHRLEDEARVWQWSFWGMTEVERAALTVLFNRMVLPEVGRDPGAADTAEEALKAPLGVLDRALTATDHLLGKYFTVARSQYRRDPVLGPSGAGRLLVFPRAEAWLRRCHDRPARSRLASRIARAERTTRFICPRSTNAARIGSARGWRPSGAWRAAQFRPISAAEVRSAVPPVTAEGGSWLNSMAQAF